MLLVTGGGTMVVCSQLLLHCCWVLAVVTGTMTLGKEGEGRSRQ